MIKAFILWAVRRNPHSINIIDFNGAVGTKRFMPFWEDEWTEENGKHHNRPPWYRPFNILLHRWIGSQKEQMHDHPRWSITICLRGRLIEETPWSSRLLTPGMVTIRSRRYIHSIKIPEGYRGKTWTIFIVGRRNHMQNYYVISPYPREY